MLKQILTVTFASCLLFSCQSEEVGPMAKAMEQYENIIFQANDGFRFQNLDGAEIPFGDITEELDSEAGSSLPPGAPEISSGGTGGPEIDRGGPEGPDISRGGTGSPELPRGGVGVPGGSGNYAGALCEFVDEVCQLLVRCSTDLSDDELACTEIASICFPLAQEVAGSIGAVPPAAFTYLQCLTNEVRSGSCSIFSDEDGFLGAVERCLPGGFSAYTEDYFDGGESENGSFGDDSDF